VRRLRTIRRWLPSPCFRTILALSGFSNADGLGSRGQRISSAIDIDPILVSSWLPRLAPMPCSFIRSRPHIARTAWIAYAVRRPVPVGQTPTGVSVNPTNHCVAVVNYGSQTVSIVPIPNSSCTVTQPTINLSNALQGQGSAALRPYAIGVDPDTNLALVAYSSTSPLPPPISDSLSI